MDKNKIRKRKKVIVKRSGSKNSRRIVKRNNFEYYEYC